MTYRALMSVNYVRKCCRKSLKGIILYSVVPKILKCLQMNKKFHKNSIYSGNEAMS